MLKTPQETSALKNDVSYYIIEEKERMKKIFIQIDNHIRKQQITNRYKSSIA